MSRCSNQLLQVFQRTFGLVDSAALDRKHDVPWTLGAHNLNHFGPVNYPIATGAAYRGAGHLAPLGARLLHRDVFGMQMDQPTRNTLQPLIRVMPTQVGVAG